MQSLLLLPISPKLLFKDEKAIFNGLNLLNFFPNQLPTIYSFLSFYRLIDLNQQGTSCSKQRQKRILVYDMGQRQILV